MDPFLSKFHEPALVKILNATPYTFELCDVNTSVKIIYEPDSKRLGLKPVNASPSLSSFPYTSDEDASSSLCVPVTRMFGSGLENFSGWFEILAKTDPNKYSLIVDSETLMRAPIDFLPALLCPLVYSSMASTVSIFQASTFSETQQVVKIVGFSRHARWGHVNS